MVATIEEQRQIFAKNLNYFIGTSGKTQKEIAKDLHIKPTTFNTWCKGKIIPNVAKVESIADYFKIDSSDLLEHEPQKEKVICLTERIKERRPYMYIKNINNRLARELGVATFKIDQIMKHEKSEVPREFVARLARVLKTTEDYLMGNTSYPSILVDLKETRWEEQKIPIEPSGLVTELENRLIDICAKLELENINAVLKYAQKRLELQEMEEEKLNK